MGTPAHALKQRADNKLFRIQNVQKPLVHTKAHMDFSMDQYPQGVNAVVAVISFTGLSDIILSRRTNVSHLSFEKDMIWKMR